MWLFLCLLVKHNPTVTLVDDGVGGGVPGRSRGAAPVRLITRLSLRTARARHQKESRLRVDWTAALLAALLVLQFPRLYISLSVCLFVLLPGCPACTSPLLWTLLSPLRQLTQDITTPNLKTAPGYTVREKHVSCQVLWWGLLKWLFCLKWGENSLTPGPGLCLIPKWVKVLIKSS